MSKTTAVMGQKGVKGQFPVGKSTGGNTHFYPGVMHSLPYQIGVKGKGKGKFTGKGKDAKGKSKAARQDSKVPVSYTHLTLPTKA